MFSEVEDATDRLQSIAVRLNVFWSVLFIGFDFCDGLNTKSRALSQFLEAYLKHSAIHVVFIGRRLTSFV